MENLATSGFELSALLAPELAGAVTGARQGLGADPRAPEPGVAPFALALEAAASDEPGAATLPSGGNILPALGRGLAATKAIDWLAAAAGQGQNSNALPRVLPGATSTTISDQSAPLLVGTTARAALPTIASAADRALPTAALPAAADASVSTARPAAVSLDPVATQLASTAKEHAAEIVRPVAKQFEPDTQEQPRDAPMQRSGEQVTARANPGRDALQTLASELPRQLPTEMTAADTANASTALSVARTVHRLEAAARPSDAGAATPTVAAVVAEASSTASVDAPKLTAELPVGNEARLPGALAERLHWMIDHNLGEARIKLNPPQLGAIDIKITLAEDQTFVQFTASQAGAREIIESALPRLRELLGAAGLALGGATVGGEATSREQPEVRWGAVPELEPLDVLEPAVRAAALADGLIDIYA